MRIEALEAIKATRQRNAWILATVAGVHLAVVGSLLLFSGTNRFLVFAGYQLPPLVALLVVAHEFRRNLGSERVGLAAVAGFLLAWYAAAWVFGLQALRGAELGFPGAADAFYYTGYAFVIAAVLLLAPPNAFHNSRRSLEALAVTVSAAAMIWQYIVPQATSDEAGLAAIVAFGYPVLDMALLVALVMSFMGTIGGAFVRTMLLAGACGLLVVSDTFLASDGIRNGGTVHLISGHDIGRICALWLFAIAIAVGDTASISIRRGDGKAMAFMQVALPFAVVAPLAAMTTLHSLLGQPAPILTVGTFVAATLLIARQWLLSKDNRELHGYRERLLTSLNTKTMELEREIVERRRAEGALRQSEERFRAVAEHLDEGLFLANLDGRIVYANPTMAYLAGYERQDFFGRRAQDVLEPWPEWFEVIGSAEDSEETAPTRSEVPSVTQDGRPIWVETYARQFHDDGEDDVSIIGIAIDVTDRKLAEEEAKNRAAELALHNQVLEQLSTSSAFSDRGLKAALRELADIAADTLDVTSVSVWLLDDSRQNLHCIVRGPESAAFAIPDLTVAIESIPNYVELMRTDIALAVTDVRKDSRVAELAPTCLTPLGIVSMLDVHLRLVGRDVGIIRCEHTGSPRIWTAAEQSLLTSMAGFAATVLEANDRQEALQGAARLAAVLSASPDQVVIWDAGGQAIYVNEAARRTLGLNESGDSVEVTLESFHPPEVIRDLHLNALPTALNTGHWSGETTVVDAEGAEMPVSQVILAHREGDETRYLATVMRDISEARKAADEKQRLNDKLQEAQKLESLGLLAGGIAHDFNNLLQSMLGNAQVARMTTPLDVKEARESLADLETAAHRAGDLVKQLLAFAGGGQTGVAPTQASELVEETVRLLLAVVTQHATVDLHLADNLPTIEADQVQLRQVVMNLMTNAADAIGEHDGQIIVRTKMMSLSRSDLQDCFLGETLLPGDYVAIEVGDTGAGMDAATLKRIFDPFFSTKEYGHGLGLAAVLGIVRTHGGALKVSSSPGSGTTFTILLPPLVGIRHGDRSISNRTAA
ncbi:MAG TPA: PAS domain S-box protein [Dehalococcoidia bacterium]|nr:PAS domain S-box protein [Dehalococcoidia bacterium]